MANEQTSQNWWSTLPGMLTASATAITAIGGLITVLVQAGLLHGASPAPASTPAPVAVSAAPETSKPANTATSNNESPATNAAATAPATTTVANGGASAGTTPSAQAKPAADSASTQPPAVASSKGDVGSNMAMFAGSWQNVHANQGNLLKFDIRNSDSTLYLHAWGKCQPTDCDWGEVQAQAIGSNVGSDPGHGARVVTAEFKNNTRQTVLTIYPAANQHLRVESQTHFTDQSGRAPIVRVFMFEKL
jgi:hypothetical protein